MNNNDTTSLFGFISEDWNEEMMHRCLQLASYGIARVAPNPMVGAVIVHDGKIIGEGFHRSYGDRHAEVNAIAAVKDRNLLKKSTLYVNLEPCSHYGKTPPCAELIIREQIPKVVIGLQDPFPEVAGKGIKMLKEAGVEVITDVLEKECRLLNKRFLTFHQKQRPYIILKWAQSADGFIDKFRESGDGQPPFRFSNDFTEILVHKMRAEESAIMVGSTTEKLDKPLLNVRYWSGNNPVKIRPATDLPQQMHELYKQQIQSLIVEGGSRLFQSFIAAHLWDEARVEINPVKLFNGVEAPKFSGQIETIQKCENSFILVYQNPLKT